jgi:hypothetical protein
MASTGVEYIVGSDNNSSEGDRFRLLNHEIDSTSSVRRYLNQCKQDY